MNNLMDAADIETIILDHGTGARLSRELVEVIAAELGPVYVGEMEDSAILSFSGGQMAMTTDSFVVQPAFFGNGHIGKVAVCGTVNDIAVSGATPRYLTLGLILEAGLPMSALRRTIRSIREAAEEADVKIVAGDTKVVGKGAADQIFIMRFGGVKVTPVSPPPKSTPRSVTPACGWITRNWTLQPHRSPISRRPHRRPGCSRAGGRTACAGGQIVGRRIDGKVRCVGAGAQVRRQHRHQREALGLLAAIPQADRHLGIAEPYRQVAGGASRPGRIRNMPSSPWRGMQHGQSASSAFTRWPNPWLGIARARVPFQRFARGA